MNDENALEGILLDMGLDRDLLEPILERDNTNMIEDVLFSLDLSNLGIRYIPDSLVELEYLERLDLSNNELTELNPVLFDLIHLSHLDLLNNPLERLPTPFVPYRDMISIEPHKVSDYTGEEYIPPDAEPTPLSPVFTPRQNATRRFYVEVDTQREADLIPILLDVYHERRCCQIAGRLEDKFCTLCGRIIPPEFKP